MRPFSLLVKPASADCNLHCTYCFYLDHSALYPQTKRHRMSDETLEVLIRTYMETEQPQYSFGWQGGEPTLMGVDFFRKVVEFQKKYGHRGASVANGLQTNATLIDDEFAAHAAEYNFLLGVSVDGPAEIHNRYRTNLAGRGSHEQVLKGIEALNRNKVEYNALVLVSSANVETPREVYQYLKSLGILYHQYIPCVEFSADGEPLPFTITGKQWGEFLCSIYDEWFSTDTRIVSIRDFDAVLSQMVDGVNTMCVQSGSCSSYFVVEYNGDIYPCDFFVEPSKLLGTIGKDSWENIQARSKYASFAQEKNKWNELCAACPYLRYCSGDCPKQRYRLDRNPRNLSWLCEGWKQFYGHSLPGFEQLAVSILNDRQATLPAPRRRVYEKLPRPRIGWNDPCYCGSGRKYRECHGTADALRRK